MTKICYVNTEKILKLNPRERDFDEEEEYDGELYVRTWENGQYVYYNFDSPDALDDFLFMLEEENIPYDLVDDEGNELDVEIDEGYGDEEEFDD